MKTYTHCECSILFCGILGHCQYLSLRGVDGSMIYKMERIWKVADVQYYTSICLKGLRKPQKKIHVLASMLHETSI